MSTFACNFGFRISSSLPFRVFLVPWVHWNKTISCLKDREYSSSGPVKYIPKKSLEINVPETSPHSKILRENESYKRSASNTFGSKITNHSSSFVDTNSQTRRRMIKKDESYNEVKQDHEIMEKPSEVVEEMHHRQVTSGNNELQVCKELLDAEKLAIELLAVRAFTAFEVRKKLVAKRFHPDVAGAVIDDFQNRGLINDGLYAEAFSRSRWSSSTWGPRRIKQALFKKGISEADAEKALKLVFEGKVGDSDDDDQKSTLCLSKLSIDHLLIQASKQWLRGQNVPKETRKARIVRWLQYRGFNWGVIGFIVKKLESQYPP